MSNDSLLSILSALECELHAPSVRNNQLRLTELLDPDFLEHGRSGATYTRAEILKHLASDSEPTRIHAQEFKIQELAPTVVLLTYRSAHVSPSGALERPSNRSSIWRLDGANWRMVFHQGTPTELFDKHGAD